MKSGMRDRIYRIFISSTFEDLKDQRKQAYEVISERGHIPTALERFSPANDSDLEVIKKEIANCQIYLLILGHRYGELVPGKNISYTELEYEIAEENGLMILSFILKKDEIKKLREKFDSEKGNEKEEMKNFDKLEKFHNRIKRFKKIWGPDDQFKFLVATALADNLPKCDKPGFIRETEDHSMELIASAFKNDFIVDTVEQLKNFKKLYKRCLQQPDEKRELAKCFREYYLDRILKNKVNLFFESGSTVAYLAREISETLSKIVKIKEKGKPNMQISTNNILAYLQLWLISRVPCTTFPWSPPLEEAYGALYGGLEKIQAKRPTYDLSPLDNEAKEGIARLIEMPYSLTTLNKPALLLGATSGLQISEEHNIIFSDSISAKARQELEIKIKACYGPHIGSYHNRIFKRFMYETKIPIMMFVTSDKVDCPIKAGETHFVLDSELTWENYCKSYPIAFCIGCNYDTKDVYMEKFQNIGFQILERTTSSPYATFFARNDEFIKIFEMSTP